MDNFSYGDSESRTNQVQKWAKYGTQHIFCFKVWGRGHQEQNHNRNSAANSATKPDFAGNNSTAEIHYLLCLMN